jgi:dienelactone hydrolase
MTEASRLRAAGALGALLAVAMSTAAAQAPVAPTSGVYDGPRHISDARMVENAAALAAQAADPSMKREATLPQDWTYSLAPGVTTRQVNLYVDGGTRLQGTLFLPKDFSPKASYPAIVAGHGINALAIGIQKYAARFAERGLVALSIDYQSYGFSDSGADELLLLDPDPSTDAAALTLTRARVRIKRTNLNNVEEVKAFRAAISWLQGEPGVDPDRVGVWGTSNAGTVLSALVGIDGRIKAAVIHVMGIAPASLAALDIRGEAFTDAVTRVRTGQGAETGAGFSFQTNVDLWYRTRNRDIAPGAMLARVRSTTPVLFLPAERDELTGGNRTALAGSAFLTSRGVPSQVITFPGLTHFQPYSGTGFEVGSHLAADWYDRFLGRRKEAHPEDPRGARSHPGGPFRHEGRPTVVRRVTNSGPALPAGVTFTEATWYSEQVKVGGRLFQPAAAGSASKPGVILAPAPGETARSLDGYAMTLAQQDIVALAVDYRGWGASGGKLHLAERVDTYDKFRLSEHTTLLAVRRGRLDPDDQVQDIRNAITFLQSHAGVDPARIGVLGVDLAGGHVVSVMGLDARAKAGVGVSAVIPGAGEAKLSHVPDASAQADLIRLAREGVPPRTEEEARRRNALEARLALAEYKPFWRIDGIPKTAALRFIVGGRDDRPGTGVSAAAETLGDRASLHALPDAGARLSADQARAAAADAAAWLKGRLD